MAVLVDTNILLDLYNRSIRIAPWLSGGRGLSQPERNDERDGAEFHRVLGGSYPPAGK
jgi:hypothetical protein